MSVLDKGYQSHPSASADSPYFDLDYSGYQKENPSNNCLERKQISPSRITFDIVENYSYNQLTQLSQVAKKTVCF